MSVTFIKNNFKGEHLYDMSPVFPFIAKTLTSCKCYVLLRGISSFTEK